MRRTWNFFKNFRNLPLILKSLKKWFWIWSLPTIIIWVWGGYLEEPHYVNLSKVSNAKDKSEFMNCILKKNRKGNWLTARTKVQIVCIQGQGSTNRFLMRSELMIFCRLDVPGGWSDRDKYHYAVGSLDVTGETKTVWEPKVSLRRARGVKFKVDGLRSKWTVQTSQTGRSKRLKADGLRKWMVLKSKKRRSKGMKLNNLDGLNKQRGYI